MLLHIQISKKYWNLSEKMQQRSSTLYSSHINALTLCQPIIWKGKVQLSFQIWYITLTTKSTSNHIRRKLSLSAMVDGQPCIDSSSSSNSGRVAAAVAVGRRESQWMGGRKRGRWSRDGPPTNPWCIIERHRHPWWPNTFWGRSQLRAGLSSLKSWFSVFLVNSSL